MRRLWGRGLAALVWATTQVGAAAPTHEMDLDAFLDATWRGNLQLQAQRHDVAAAHSQISAARAFAEPTISAGLGAWDPAGIQPLGYALALSQALELGGKRRARVAVATRGAQQAADALSDAWRLLRADAAARFVTSLALDAKLARRRRTQAALDALVLLNEQRERAGDIGAIAARQSRVEATRFRGEVMATAAELQVSLVALAGDLGDRLPPATRLCPTGNLALPRADFDLAALMLAAQTHRPDLLAAEAAEATAAAQLALARANRWEDVTLAASWLHSPPNGNPAYAQPPHLLAITASLPLPVARVYTGARDAAARGLEARAAERRAAQRRAALEVRGALAALTLSGDRLALYTGDLLAEADAVAAATAYSYRRGAASLLEVLAAQRTVNEVALDYLDAQLSHLLGRIDIQRACGTWNFSLPAAASGDEASGPVPPQAPRPPL